MIAKFSIHDKAKESKVEKSEISEYNIKSSKGRREKYKRE